MKVFSGLYTGLVSPFCDGEFDEESFKNLLGTQGSVDGIIIGGLSGEGPTLTPEEMHRQIALANEHFAGKIIVVIASNHTMQAIESINILDQITRIDAYLVLAPYYNCPNQIGIFEHYSAIAESTRRPIILYSNPSHCGIEIGVDTVVRLAEENNNIIGMKEASDNCARIDDFYRLLPEDFSILSGLDAMTLPFMAQGAVGIMGASGNILADEMKSMVDLANGGDFSKARAIHSKIIPLIRALFSEPMPIIIKYILEAKHIIRSGEVRLPLYASSEEKLQVIAEMFH